MTSIRGPEVGIQPPPSIYRRELWVYTLQPYKEIRIQQDTYLGWNPDNTPPPQTQS